MDVQVEHISIFCDEERENFWIGRQEDRRFPSVASLVEEHLRDERSVETEPLTFRPATWGASGDLRSNQTNSLPLTYRS